MAVFRGPLKAAAVGPTWPESADERAALRGPAPVPRPPCAAGVRHEAVGTAGGVFPALCGPRRLRDVPSQTVLPVPSVPVVSVPGDCDSLQGEWNKHWDLFTC